MAAGLASPPPAALTAPAGTLALARGPVDAPLPAPAADDCLLVPGDRLKPPPATCCALAPPPGAAAARGTAITVVPVVYRHNMAAM
jgi:hypothetical protein